MKRRLSLIALALLVCLSVASVALAYNGPPIHDSWVDGSENNYNGQTMKLFASNAGACTPTSTMYLRWDISSIMGEPVADKTIAFADMDLYVSNASFSAPITVSLYQVLNDDWDEATISGANAPAVGALITTFNVSSPPAAGTKITIASNTQDGDPTNDGLANFLQAQNPANDPAGDGEASFALRITGCGLGTSRIDFYDRASGATQPYLALENPNAITLLNLEADSPTATPLLLGGFALLLVAAGAGLLWTRRNQAAS